MAETFDADSLLVSGWLESHLADFFPGNFQVEKLEARGSAFYYRADDSSGSYFVRVYPQDGGGDLEQKILQNLQSAGAKVCPILHTVLSPAAANSSMIRLDVKPFISPSRFFDHSDADFFQITNSLKTIHDALAVISESAMVQEAALLRARRHAETVTQLIELIRHDQWAQYPQLESWGRDNISWMKEFCEKIDPAILRLPDAQVLHGDVHPGNVLFSNEGLVFIDFEHSLYTYAPRQWDLAYLFQRFCRQDGVSPGTLRLRRGLVEKIYQLDLALLPEFMRLTSWLCVAILFTGLFERNAEIPLSELDKFVRLEREAQALKSLW